MSADALPPPPPRLQAALTELAASLGAGRDSAVVSDPDTIAGAGIDWTGRVTGSPAAVVRPSSAAEVAEVVRWAARNGVGVVAQGGNTGLVGGAIAVNGEICLQLGRLDQLGEVDELAAQVTVGAGVTLEALQAHARESGLRFGIAPCL